MNYRKNSGGIEVFSVHKFENNDILGNKKVSCTIC